MTQVLRSANDDGLFATQSLSKFCTKFHRVLLWFAKKLGALCVFLHRDSPNFFLILIALIRDTPRHFAFFLCEPCEKNFALFAFKFTQSYTEHFWFWLRWKELHRDDSLSSWRSLRKTFASLRLNLHRATPSFFFLILIVLKRDPPRRLTFFLANFA